MRTLVDNREALAMVQQLLANPRRFSDWLAADPDRLFSPHGRRARHPLARFLSASGVPLVFQNGERLYVGMTPIELPGWAQHLSIPANRAFLARYLLFRLQESA